MYRDPFPFKIRLYRPAGNANPELLAQQLMGTE